MGEACSHLSEEERQIIQIEIGNGTSIRRIGLMLGRNASTVGREIKRDTWFPSNENESYRPYRPKRLKTGPWTGGYYIAGPAAAQGRPQARRTAQALPPVMRTPVGAGGRMAGCLCSISCCGFSHDDFSGLGRACRPRNGLNWMVLVSPPERTGKDYDQHAPSTVYPSFAAERGIRRVDRAENTCRRSRRCVSTSRRRICRPCRR